MCGESRMHGVERGKIRRLFQRITYRYPNETEEELQVDRILLLPRKMEWIYWNH